jgi:hypothetical protein
MESRSRKLGPPGAGGKDKLMSISHFESRTGKLNCNAEKVFNFVTDIRNFERFIPDGRIKDWQADKDSCSFSVSMLGTVRLRLTQKNKFTHVVFAGDALKENDFELSLFITDNLNNESTAKIDLQADLNPMLKMMAAKPIEQFLGMLINEMEKFKGWEDTKE